jgi:VCBS repeat-containing protein
MKNLLFISLSIISFAINAQDVFRGRLLNISDSLKIPSAIIRIYGSERFVQTDEEGYFNFKIDSKQKQVKIIVYAINIRDTLTINITKDKLHNIYVDINNIDLQSVTITGMSAKETVLKAVSLISANYSDSSYAAFSSYRQYEIVNNITGNLIETDAIILYKIKKAGNKLSMSNAFRINEMRRTNIIDYVDGSKLSESEFSYFIKQNPVYNLTFGSLNPNALSFYSFSFDTTNKTEDIIINYICPDFTSESHGITNYTDLDLMGEGWERGRLTIDSRSFAFKKIERYSQRNPNYHYPFNNNYILPKRNYYSEFINGELIVEFREITGKYFISKAFHRYLNDYYSNFSGKVEYKIEQISELYCDSITKFLTPNLLDGYDADPYLHMRLFNYNPAYWSNNSIPFYFKLNGEIYNELNFIDKNTQF